jgi:hypothetical protein
MKYLVLRKMGNMIWLVLSLLMILFQTDNIIFDFDKNSNMESWNVVNDDVMGGRSSGQLEINAQGHAVFSGMISLENNGGFSSLRYRPERIMLGDATKVRIRLKGDAKKYQLRIKANADDYYSYVANFTTSGNWETIKIDLKDMYPTFRGRMLEKPNFNDDHLEEIGILIGNKKAQEFELMIDKIQLQ